MKLHNREIVFQSIAGSVNRNLNDENSDLDYKVFVLPTFEDLYESKVYKNFTTSDEKDVEIHDVRKLEKLLYNSNLSYLELFFSQQIDTFGHKEIDELLLIKEDLPKINLKSLYNSCLGMYNGQFKDLKNANSELQKSIIDRYGYNTKKAMMAMHFLKFITSYYETDFSDFKKSIWYEGNDREFMLDIKQGKYNLYEITKLLYEELDKAEQLKSSYYSFEVDEILNEYVKDLLRTLVRNNFQ